MAETVDILVRLRNLQSLITGSREASTALRGIGTAAERASVVAVASARRVPTAVRRISVAAKESAVGVQSAGRRIDTVFASIGRAASRAAVSVRSHMGRIRTAIERPIVPKFLKGLAGGLVGGALAFASVAGIKSAVDNTTKLAIQAQNMSRVMGMSTQQAADWLAVTQAWGVNTKTLGMSFKMMATQASNAGKGNKTSIGLFKDLGISMKDVRGAGGNMNSMMNLVMDHLNKMPAGARKTSDATKLLGRGWMSLMPMLSQGSKRLAEQRKLAEAYGVTLGKDPVKNAIKLHDAQVQLKLAGIGLQVMFTRYLVPALMTMVRWGLAVFKVVRQQMGPAYNWLKGIVESVTAFLRHHHTILMFVRDALILFAGAVLLGKTYLIAERLAILAMKGPLVAWKILQAAATGVQWAWNAATAASTGSAGRLGGKLAGISSGMGVIPAKATGALNALKTFGLQGLAAVAPLALKVAGLIGALAAAQVALGQLTGGQATTTGSNRPSGGLSNLNVGSGGRGGSGVDLPLVGHVPLPFGIGGGATGALVTRPTLALIGEAGPELLTPLSRLPGNRPLAQQTAQLSPYRLSGDPDFRAGPRVQPIQGARVLAPKPVKQGEFKLPDIIVPVNIDRREIARATGKFVDDKVARR